MWSRQTSAVKQAKCDSSVQVWSMSLSVVSGQVWSKQTSVVKVEKCDQSGQVWSKQTSVV